MIGLNYNANFYQHEVRRLTSALTESTDVQTRASLQHQLASARKHLEGLTK
jgi:hypothetical protein